MLHYYTYHIPFSSPFKTAAGTFSHREGIILVFKTAHTEAYGEIAPLPGFSDETLEEVTQVLLTIHAYLQEALQAGTAKQLLNVLDQIHDFPSLSFGLDTLIHDLEAKKAQKPLGAFLFEQFPSTISSNATLSIQQPESMLEKAELLVNEGFTTLKVKVGADFEEEQKALETLRRHFSDVSIRIDANQSWSKEEAIQNLNALKSLNIEYCEQPVPKNETDALAEIASVSPVPIAADESIRNTEQAKKLIEEKAAHFFILKPMLLGSFKKNFVTKHLADTLYIESVFTTSLGMGVAQATTAILAAGLANPNRAQGLATGKLLSADICSDSWLNKPIIRFPETPGLGITLHKKGLKRIK